METGLSNSQIQKILKVEKKSNKEIDRLLAGDKEKLKNAVTLLLLGPGESGKSTVAKQLRIINQKPWTDEERISYKEVVISNLLKSFKDVLEAAQNFGFKLDQQEIDLIINTEYLTPEVAKKMSDLLENEGIKETLKRADEFLLKDSAPYYFSSVLRLAEPNYVPTDEDILRSRKKTTAIHETLFEIDNVTCKVVDVGGQRSQRKKWIHLFQDVTAVVFCASLSCYNLKLREDMEISGMTDCLDLFDDIINNKWFKNTPVILFLNKVDLLKEKITHVPISTYFEDYKGDPHDVEESTAFIRRKFISRSKNPDKQIHTLVTCATDTNNIAAVFQTIKKILLQQVVNNQIQV